MRSLEKKAFEKKTINMRLEIHMKSRIRASVTHKINESKEFKGTVHNFKLPFIQSGMLLSNS